MNQPTDSTNSVKLTFLGTGTSHGIPVISCGCQVCTSINNKDKRLRSSVKIECNETRVVIDVGPDFRTQMLRENVHHLDAFLMTHEHRDHMAGIDDVRVFNYQKKGPVDFYCSKKVEQDIRKAFSYIFEVKDYPGLPSIDFHEIDIQPFTIGDLQIQPVPVVHYKLPVLGFRMGDLAYVTDVSFIPESSMELLKGVKILVLGCLRKKPHISHFHLDEALQVAKQIGADKTYLIHMSHDMGLHDEVEAELPPNVHLSYDGLQVAT